MNRPIVNRLPLVMPIAAFVAALLAAFAWAWSETEDPSTPDTSPRLVAATANDQRSKESAYLVTCGHQAIQRPATFALQCGSGTYALDDLDWTQWESNNAVATGRYMEKDCTPNCAEGRIVSYPVTVKASAPMAKVGVPFYAKLTLTFTGARPSWAKTDPHASFDVGPGSGHLQAEQSARVPERVAGDPGVRVG